MAEVTARGNHVHQSLVGLSVEGRFMLFFVPNPRRESVRPLYLGVIKAAIRSSGAKTGNKTS